MNQAQLIVRLMDSLDSNHENLCMQKIKYLFCVQTSAKEDICSFMTLPLIQYGNIIFNVKRTGGRLFPTLELSTVSEPLYSPASGACGDGGIYLEPDTPYIDEFMIKRQLNNFKSKLICEGW